MGRPKGTSPSQSHRSKMRANGLSDAEIDARHGVSMESGDDPPVQGELSQEDHIQAVRRWQVEKADAAELDNQVKRGELVPASAVATIWYQVAEKLLPLRNGLIAQGTKLAAELVGMTNAAEIQAIIDRDNRELLDGLVKLLKDHAEQELKQAA